MGDGVEAVLFLDRAELLACLAADELRGVAGARWWWRLLGPQPRLAQAFLEAPEHVPAALELVAAKGEAGGVVRTLTDAAAAAVLAAVRRVFAVSEPPAETLAEAEIEPRARSRTRARENIESHESPRVVAEPARPASAPWAALVPEVRAARLTPVQEELLGTALVLRRAPPLARATSFAGAVARWRAEVRALPSEESTAHERPGPTFPRQAAPSPGPQPQARAPTRRTAPPRAPEAPTDAASEPAPEPARSPAPTETAAAPEPPDTLPARLAPEPAPAPAPAEGAAAAARGAPVTTEVGGAFYLLNAALALGLYGDFTTPAEPGIELDPWDFVALLAEDLLVEPQPADPLWPVLADLAGRDAEERPGRGFEPPGEWRVPAEWTAPFDDERPLRWRAAHGRLVVLHPAGFAVVDVPRRGGLREQALAEAGGGAIADRGGGLALPGDPLRRWTSHLAAYLRARLGAALDAPDPATLSRRLLEHRAEVFVTATHVDAVLRLDELPLEIRIAGLDRTPGWIPAAGRFLAFHFE